VNSCSYETKIFYFH